MPSEEQRKEYHYEPCDLVPPVGENLMAHWFNHPEDADTETMTCLLSPKKRKDKLKVCPKARRSVGWGIHIVEGWIILRLWLLVMLFIVIGSLIFGVCWTILKSDIQGAFGVSAYIVTVLALVLGILQMWQG